MSKLVINDIDLDQFYKSIMFQKISDIANVDLYERTILFYIFRKTIHFNKWADRISMFKIKQDTKMSLTKVRQSVRSLERKNLIAINKSLGGHTSEKTKWNEFSIAESFIFHIHELWEIERDSLGIEAY